LHRRAASGAPVFVVAGFAKGGARIVVRKDALVMTEKLYGNRDVALRTMKCFVEATKEFIDKPDEAEKYVREKMFRGALTGDEYKDAMGNAAFTYDITPEQVQITADLMTKYPVGRMSRTPKAEEFVKLDLLQEAKRAAGIK
jgi:NitT/TauT family transport system substrate-binding protein